MQPLSTYRTWQLETLHKNQLAYKSILQIVSPDGLNVYRDNGTGWTATEVLCHLRDFEAVYLERAKLTMEQDFPALPFPNPDQLALDRHYNAQSAMSVYDEWVETRRQLLNYFQSITHESDWERPGNHPKRGRFTLNDQLILIPWHDTNHLEQMTRILTEKKS